MSVISRYGEVLRPPGAATALAASLFGRLALGMNGLALLILIKALTGSYSDAGIISASYAVFFAVGAPSRARTADRRGPRGVLVACGVLHPGCFALLVLLAEQHAPIAVLAVAAALVGMSVPPLGAVMRALWGQLLDPPQLPTAYSLESVVIETCFVVGPLVVAALASAIDPVAGVVASAAVAATGSLALAANPVVRTVVPHAERPTSLAGPLVSRVVRACLLNVLWIGAGFGTIEVGVLAFVDEQGSARATAGVVLAVWSCGSILGGLVYGGLHLRTAAARQLPLLVVLVGVGAFLPVLAPGIVTLAAVLVLSGSTIAPFSACNSVLLGAAAPAGTVTEAFAWNGSMIFGGAAAGTALAGFMVDAYGARSAFVATAATGILVIVSSMAGLTALRGHEVPVAD
ncbi:MAG: transporter [Frankiales bacterium]|nr:transporter [Frankiales bacterium]